MVDVIHMGPTKTATTWLYEAVSEHPKIQTPKNDSIHYFDINYHRGEKWYKEKYDDIDNGKITMEFTPSYIWCEESHKRIKKDLDDPKLVVCIRNPIKRSFSHYWHEKKKKRYNYDFEECVSHYDLFQNWIEGSMYGKHLSRLAETFSVDSIHFMNFNNLKKEPKTFIKNFYNFIGVNEDHLPSILNKKVNEARPMGGIYMRKVANFLKRKNYYSGIKNTYKTLQNLFGISPRMEKLTDVNKEFIYELGKIFEEDSAKAQKICGIDPLNLDG
jgi:hypothetical protein